MPQSYLLALCAIIRWLGNMLEINKVMSAMEHIEVSFLCPVHQSRGLQQDMATEYPDR